MNTGPVRRRRSIVAFKIRLYYIIRCAGGDGRRVEQRKEDPPPLSTQLKNTRCGRHGFDRRVASSVREKRIGVEEEEKAVSWKMGKTERERERSRKSKGKRESRAPIEEEAIGLLYAMKRKRHRISISDTHKKKNKDPSQLLLGSVHCDESSGGSEREKREPTNSLTGCSC